MSYASSHGLAQTTADSLRSLDSAWARAYATHDTTLAKALFADDLVVTSANGSLKDKAGELGDVRPAPNLHVAFFRTKDVSIAVETGKLEPERRKPATELYQSVLANLDPARRQRLLLFLVKARVLEDDGAIVGMPAEQIPHWPAPAGEP